MSLTNATPPDNQPNQVWRVDQDESALRAGTASWMSQVRGNPKLSMLNLVGTHQSLQLHGKASQGHEGPETWSSSPLSMLDNPRCQNRPPLEQLVDGVRLLDCRFSVWNQNGWATSLYAWHGANNSITGAAEGYSLTAVLQSIQLFLSKNPSETLIVRVEKAHDVDGFEAAFRNDFHGFEHLFYQSNIPGKASIYDIHLDDVRGKAILMSSETWARSISECFDPGVFWGKGLSSAGKNDCEKREWSSNLQVLQDHIQTAKQDRNEDHYYSTDWFASNFTDGYNPCDWYIWAHDTAVKVFNSDNIGVDGQYRIGVVNFDLYELLWNETLRIIQSNPGCASVTR